MKTLDVEIAIAGYFNYRTNMIIPNVSWGFNIHECDLLVCTKAGYLYEVEIKVSKADLIKDKEKTHKHISDKIKKLFFAIPEKLEKDIGHIPERAGILVCYEKEHKSCGKYIRVECIRWPHENKTEKISNEDRYSLARLAAMRTWTLKRNIQKLK